MRNTLLTIIVVSYNTKNLTLACLRSLFAQTINTNFDVIVFDNASTDGSFESIEREFAGRVTLINSETNIGFAAANNKAAQIARGELLLLLNPDTVILDRAIDRLIEFSDLHPHSEIWGGRTVFGNGSLNPASCWSRQTIWSLTSQALGLTSLFRRSSIFNPEGIGGWDREGIREVDIVSGCFFLIRRDIWERLNGFREIFFMYGEEADLCLRAHKIGAKPMVTSAATIIHYGGASESVRADKMVRLLRAKMLLIREHFSTFTKPLGYFLLYLWPLSRLAAYKILILFDVSKREGLYAWCLVHKRKDEWLL